MKYRIGIGLGVVPVEPGAYADVVGGIGRHGFDSLWISDILTRPGPDVLIALGWAAQVDPHLKLGTTLLLPGRNPVRLARSLATLDAFSDGRLLVTFVPGLTQGVEREAIGVPPADRGRVIEQTLPRLRAWWAGEEVEGITIDPRPVQQPLECWLGGIAPSALRRCGEFADGWLTAMCTPEEAQSGRKVIEQAAEAAGRQIDPEHFGVSIAYSRDPLSEAQLTALATRARGNDPRLLVPVGLPAVHQLLEQFMAAGLSKFVLRPMASTLPWDQQLAELYDAVGNLQT
jgi:probable F420-dependent oxidoreductase